MIVNNYSNYSVDQLAKLSYANTDAHPELFRKLAVSEESYGRKASFAPAKILKILGDITPEVAPLAARGIGTSFLKSQKKPLFTGLNVLLEKNLSGTALSVARVAKEKLTKVQNHTLLTRIITRDPELGLNALGHFKITKEHKKSAIKAIVLASATQNKINMVAPLIILANEKDLFTRDQRNDFAQTVVDISPQFAVRFVEELNLKNDAKIALIQKLAEKIPKAYNNVTVGKFHSKLSTTKDRINIDAPLFASIKDNQIELRQLVMSHAQKRTHLFFNLLTAYYKTGVSLSLNKTLFRYGKGSRTGGSFDGCHTSIITSLKIKQNADDAFWDESSFYDLYLAHSCNGTFFLPTKVNNVDSKIEGKNNSGEPRMRQHSISILRRVAAGEINPEQGMYEYLNAFVHVAQHVGSNDENLSEEQRLYLDYQVEGTLQITSQERQILGNFFRHNLALSIPETPEIHNCLKATEWKDMSPEAKEFLFIRAQQETQSQKVLVVDGKAVQ